MAFVRSYCMSVYYFENRLLRFKFGREDHVTRSGEVNPRIAEIKLVIVISTCDWPSRSRESGQTGQVVCDRYNYNMDSMLNGIDNKVVASPSLCPLTRPGFSPWQT